MSVEVMSLMVHLLRTDNEENGAVCVKIVIDYHRTYKAALEQHVQPFIDVVLEMYSNMEALVQETFREDAPVTAAAEVSELIDVMVEIMLIKCLNEPATGRRQRKSPSACNA